MELKVISNPNTFFAATEGYLAENEAQNNLPLGIIGSLIRDPRKDEQLLAMVEKAGNPILVLIKAGGPLILAGLQEFLPASVQLFAEFVQEERIKIPGVIGPKEQVQSFTEIWKDYFSVDWEEIMEQRIFRLDQLRVEPSSPGSLRPALEKDIDQVSEWVEMFSREADPGGEIPPALAREKAEGGIKEKEFFLWEDKRPVSMAKKTRPTRNGIAISMVYTPPEFRNRGYATSCVSALSKNLLEDGFKFCTLFTDANNPTSNKIYEEIGFREVGSGLVGKFSPRK